MRGRALPPPPSLRAAVGGLAAALAAARRLGARSLTHCASCGTAVRVGHPACPLCGAAIPESDAAPAARLRRAGVLELSVVGVMTVVVVTAWFFLLAVYLTHR